MKRRKKIRSLFISDVHLGCRYCKAEQLLKFLRSVKTEHLYLVGDILDGYKMKRNIYWDDTYSFIVRRMIGMVKDGTKVVYLAGNHDEFIRKFVPNVFGHVSIVNECVHETANGDKLLLIHGDQFDMLALKAPWLYFLGDHAHSFALWLNECFNWVRKVVGMPYWSLSLHLKRNVKKAVNFVNNFEHFIAEYTKQHDCVGVVCGHIHTPAVKKIEGIDYYNCGDWVESCTALVEHLDGRMELVHYDGHIKGPQIEAERDSELEHDTEPEPDASPVLERDVLEFHAAFN
jgi:UDP-2,3-diacylglucosamine pyrophosphatase LpxH